MVPMPMFADGKLGKAVVADAVIDGTVRKFGPLPGGAYTIESTVKGWAIQCNKAVNDTPPTAAQIRAQGTQLPAASEVGFCVAVPQQAAADTEGDGYVVYVMDAASVAGTVRVNDRSHAAGAVS